MCEKCTKKCLITGIIRMAKNEKQSPAKRIKLDGGKEEGFQVFLKEIAEERKKVNKLFNLG